MFNMVDMSSFLFYCFFVLTRFFLYFVWDGTWDEGGRGIFSMLFGSGDRILWRSSLLLAMASCRTRANFWSIVNMLDSSGNLGDTCIVDLSSGWGRKVLSSMLFSGFARMSCRSSLPLAMASCCTRVIFSSWVKFLGICWGSCLILCWFSCSSFFTRMLMVGMQQENMMFAEVLSGQHSLTNWSSHT